jgi:hypothetical protein
MKFCAVALILATVAIAQSDKTADAVLDRLANIDRFAFGGIGYAGVTSDGEKDYKLILSRPTALRDFERLYSSGNLQAKCYALVGIRRLAPGRFEELSKSLLASKQSVLTQSGCIVSSEAFGAIVNHIQAGLYDLRSSRN